MKNRRVAIVIGLAVVLAAVAPARAVRLPEGTPVRVRLVADLLSAQVTEGSRVDLEVARSVTAQGVVVIPQGATAWGAVQVAKKGKTLRFDIEGVRLPDQKIIKLRCSPQKTARVAKDEIKVESEVGGDVGAAKGSEFTAYLDEEVSVEGGKAAPAASAASAAPEATPQAAPAAGGPATKATEMPAVAGQSSSGAAPLAPRPALSAPTRAAAAPAATPARAGGYVTVMFFSDPLGADIMIDDEYHGSTPSILKLRSGKHQVEFRLMGYRARSQDLDLAPDTPPRDVRVTLTQE